jgi:hypothetical protein
MLYSFDVLHYGEKPEKLVKVVVDFFLFKAFGIFALSNARFVVT